AARASGWRSSDAVSIPSRSTGTSITVAPGSTVLMEDPGYASRIVSAMHSCFDCGLPPDSPAGRGRSSGIAALPRGIVVQSMGDLMVLQLISLSP
ncbi:hypothetical protein, partial [Burkholderia cenocepacia]|uniref:hypothetical protein n=1 Tax=Burkholderia cenocepacia TaxID=95486 RepID=UPI0024B68992